MKSFKNTTLAHRFLAFALVFAFAIGMLGTVPAFATEANIESGVSTRSVRLVATGNSNGYISGTRSYTVTIDHSDVYYFTYFYENQNGQGNQGKVVFSGGPSHVTRYLTHNPSIANEEAFTLQKGTYTITISGGTSSYMYSFNLYWKD